MVDVFRAVAADAAVNAPVRVNRADSFLALPTQTEQPLLLRDLFARVLGDSGASRNEDCGKAPSAINQRSADSQSAGIFASFSLPAPVSCRHLSYPQTSLDQG